MNYDKFQKYLKKDPEVDYLDFAVYLFHLITLIVNINLLVVSKLMDKPFLIKTILMISGVRNMVSCLDLDCKTFEELKFNGSAQDN